MSERRQAIWFFLIAFWILAVGFGLRDPWPADEPRFVLVAKQMVESGDWLFPHRGSELYPDKPPVYFWLLALCFKLTGSWRWSFLLPSLLSGMGVLWLVRDLAKRLWNPAAGLWAAIAVLSALQFVYQFKRAQIDPTLVLFTTLAFYGLCRHLLLGPHWRWFWAGCFAAGIGVILKGVGFLPLLALLPYAAMRYWRWQGIAELGPGNIGRWSLGVVAFFAAIGLWLVPMLSVALSGDNPEHQAYVQNLLFKQTAERYVDPWHHYEPAWYFLEIVGLFWAPFSLAFLWLWRDWKNALSARDARVWLPLAWGLLVLAFFSASAGKRDMYILPALPAFALAAAPFLPALTQRRGFRWCLWGFALLLGALLLGLGASALLSDPSFARKLAEERDLGGEARRLWMMLAVVGGVSVLSALVLRPARGAIAVAIALVAVWSGYGLVAHPALDPSSSSSALMARARALAGPDRTIGLVDWKEQNLLQAVGPTTEFGFRAPRELQLKRAEAWLRELPATRVLLVQEDKPGECVRLDAAHAQRVGVANRRTWWLAGRDALATTCP
ncbi:ArnT family glycosyltransferase [Arenimonas sp.]|uniref:ArnT family glycosyltransferase n=1 Tax=Arenimonas sp. TaxID=1872635 RepID=UPI0039E462C7